MNPILKLDNRIYPLKLIEKAARDFEHLGNIRLSHQDHIVYVSITDSKVASDLVLDEFSNYVLEMAAKFEL